MDPKDFVDFLRDKVPQIQKECKNLNFLAIMILLTPKESASLPKWKLWCCELNAALHSCAMFYDEHM